MNAKQQVASREFPITYHQGLGLRSLIEVAMGNGYKKNINPDITEERFKLAGRGYRTVVVRILPYLIGETPEKAWSRLRESGCRFANAGDLALFLLNYPEVVEDWAWITVVGEESRWYKKRDDIQIPTTSIVEKQLQFGLCSLNSRLFDSSGILIIG